MKMVITGSSGSGRKRLVKGSSNSKGKTFYQEGSVVDTINMEPLSSASPTTLLSYDTFEEDSSTPVTSKKQPLSPIEESPKDQGLNHE